MTTQKITLKNTINSINKMNDQVIDIRQTTTKVLKIILAALFVFVLFVLMGNDSFAVTDVFAKVNTKGNTIITGLRDIAVVIATVAIMVVGFMMYKGRIGNQMAFGIIIGSIVLGAAAEIADLLIN